MLLYAYVYLHMHVCVRMCIHTYFCIFNNIPCVGRADAQLFVCMYLYMCAYICMCVHVCVYICMLLCVYTFQNGIHYIYT